ncbi:hypothetical protein ABE65_010430 [Fictibacillus phosphorivorans]|uniref:Uncharacterized protein n=1 Tax=Fictibacillus phosphorivorans TaxID=1221500 RepID=A0A160IMJ3_9BACL|nr:hypothetical protein [Fictibacillus phosphorivorans]ANC77196.1 hypothetical protein ABE65_010430 [Fictibacillus phosphorivorans]
MKETLKVNILFYDLDKKVEMDLNEAQIKAINPEFSIKYLIEEAHNLNGTLLKFNDGMKRIVNTDINYEDKDNPIRTIIFKFQNEEKAIY